MKCLTSNLRLDDEQHHQIMHTEHRVAWQMGLMFFKDDGFERPGWLHGHDALKT